MREILFRGKRLDNGKWIYGCLRQYQTGAAGICDRVQLRTYHVDPETVGQYTGLKDKNGKKIFEGDIVEAVLPRSKAQNGFVWPLMPVVFRDGIFGLLTARDEVVPFTAFAPAVTLEVKGNIHDHPEMLKGEKANEG